MNERTLRSAFERDFQGFTCSSGSRFRDKFAVVYNSRGGKHLEKVGEANQYEMIQSHRDSCDLHKILERCMSTGDLSALQRMQGVFTDLTGYPADSRAFYDVMHKAKFIYEGLDTKVKSLYPSFDAFLENFANQQNISAFLESVTEKVNVTPSEGGENNES